MKGITKEGGTFDADELIKAIDKALSLYETDGGYLSRADITAILNSQQRIRQGTCIIVSNPYPRTDYRCSVCDERITNPEIKFCPDCGSRVSRIMKGKEAQNFNTRSRNKKVKAQLLK